MAAGCLALVLHCHLPYVRHPDREDVLEEDWLHEAVAETYLPLLQMFEELEREGVPFRVTLSISPTLCELLSNVQMQQRCAGYLDRHAELAEREVRRTAGTPFAAAARMYRRHYGAVRRQYVDALEGRVLSEFGAWAERGRVELIASAATHAILPLVATPEGRRAQVAVGLDNFEKHFGRRPAGFWLPECAYAPGLEDLLADFGLTYFFLDTHGVLLADPQPPYGVFAPLATPAGTLAFGRDVESSRQVWSAQAGYPGHPDYREFYRDLGFDGDAAYLAPYLHGDGVRSYLGLKYHRVTGDVGLGAKEPYRPDAAAERAALDAAHFVRERVQQARRVREATGIEPLIVAPYDGELFGHWWYEGVRFLKCVFREAAAQGELTCVTPGEYLAGAAEQDQRPWQAGRPAMSSWGAGGYFGMWVNESNDWLYPRVREAETALVAACTGRPGADGLVGRALDQCARLLMLAQSSDWAFLMSSGTARDYATRRFQGLMQRFDDLLARAGAGRVDRRVLQTYEKLDDPFPEVRHSVFACV